MALTVDNATSGTQDTAAQKMNVVNPAPPPVVIVPPMVQDPSVILLGATRAYNVPAGTYAVSVQMADGSVQTFANVTAPGTVVLV